MKTMFFLLALVTAAVTAQVNAPVVQGDLKMNLDHTVYSVSPQEIKLEIFYEIPYFTLTFRRNSTGFIARYRLAVEVWDQKRQSIFGDMWTKTVAVPDYAGTVNQHSTASEVITLNLPRTARQVRIIVSDLFSERTASVLFPLKKAPDKLIIRLEKSGKTNPTRIYRINDTIEVIVQPFGNISGDSVRFLVKKQRRVPTGATVPVTESLGIPRARLVIPIHDSSGTPRFSSGEYTVVATLVASDSIIGTDSVKIRIELPFYYDESTWTLKVDQLLYIATYEQMRELKRTPREGRQKAWEDFWRDKDPNPSTAVNEQEEEYFARIEYAERHFAKGDNGYRSDRARIYVQYGPPDEIESRPFAVDRPAEEIWYYYQNNLTFVFVDRFGSGQFILVSPGRW